MLDLVLTSECQFEYLPRALDMRTIPDPKKMKRIISRCKKIEERVSFSLYFSAEYKAELNMIDLLPLNELQNLWSKNPRAFAYGLFCSIPDAFIVDRDYCTFLNEIVSASIAGDYQKFLDIFQGVNFWCGDSPARNILQLEKFRTFLSHFFDRDQRTQEWDFEGKVMEFWKVFEDYAQQLTSEEELFRHILSESEKWIEQTTQGKDGKKELKILSKASIKLQQNLPEIEKWMKSLKKSTKYSPQLLSLWLKYKSFSPYTEEEGKILSSVIDVIGMDQLESSIYYLPEAIFGAKLDRNYFLEFLNLKKSKKFNFQEASAVGKCELISHSMLFKCVPDLQYLAKFPEREQKYILNLFALLKLPNSCWFLLTKDVLKIILKQVFSYKDKFLLFKRNLPSTLLNKLMDSYGLSSERDYMYMVILNITNTEWELHTTTMRDRDGYISI
jgi:hypothetical protein